MGNEKRGQRFSLAGRVCAGEKRGGEKKKKKKKNFSSSKCLFKSNVNYAESDSFFPFPRRPTSRFKDRKCESSRSHLSNNNNSLIRLVSSNFHPSTNACSLVTRPILLSCWISIDRKNRRGIESRFVRFC